MSYRYRHEVQRDGYVYYLEREVERLADLLCEEHGYDVAAEIRTLESEIERLENVIAESVHRTDDLLAKKDVEVKRAQDGTGIAALQVENLNLRSDLQAESSRLRSEISRLTAAHAALTTENTNLRSQVANLMATSRRGPPAKVVAEVVKEEPDSGRGIWAGLEL